MGILVSVSRAVASSPASRSAGVDDDTVTGPGLVAVDLVPILMASVVVVVVAIEEDMSESASTSDFLRMLTLSPAVVTSSAVMAMVVVEVVVVMGVIMGSQGMAESQADEDEAGGEVELVETGEA
jgi:hypothetical protein